MKKIVFKVKGMECYGCENRIINALKNIKLINHVVANYETGIVEVDADGTIDENLIKEKIIDLGFDII